MRLEARQSVIHQVFRQCAMLVMNGTWQKPGVYNIEEFDPDPFMDALNKWGLPWKESWDPALVD